MRRTIRAGAVLAAGLLAAALAACGGSSPSSGSGSASGPSGTLTISNEQGTLWTCSFNPFNPSNLAQGVTFGQVYEPLAFVNTLQSGKATPWLATAWAWGAGNKSLTFTIRNGVKWNDGTPMTAADVAFTFNLMKKFPTLDLNSVWSVLSSVTQQGNKVVMTFKNAAVPYFYYIADQTPIVPQHIWSTIANPVKYTNTHPVGTGPFILSSFAPTQPTLKKNPLYWDAAKIAPTSVVFPSGSTSQATNQLEVSSGKFDWAYTYMPDVKATYVDRDPAYNKYWFPPGGSIGLYLNLTQAPYNNVKFRQGISLALNRATIAKKAVNGYMAPASLSGLILPNEQQWLNPSLPNRGVVSQDIPAAMAAFAKAGYHLSGGKLTGPNGAQATMTIVLPNNYTDWAAAATEISSELRAVGIAVSLNEPQDAQYEQTIQAGTFNAALSGFGGTGSPYTDFSQALNGSYAAPVHTPTVNNFERFKSPAFDQALATLAAATSPAAQRQATDKLEQMTYKQVPIVLLYYGGSWGLFSTKHFTGWPSASDPYTLPTTYNYSLLTVVTHLAKA